MSPSAAAPNSASVIAWQSASASEWPAQPVRVRDLDAAEDELPAGDERVRVPALADAPERAARLHAVGVARAQQRLGEREVAPGSVTLMFSAEPGTSFGAEADRLDRRRPRRSRSGVRASASARTPRRNICGVCACQTSSRARVDDARDRLRRFLSVSATGSASRPPMPSSRQASISASIHSARTRQRAASWTSTQSSAVAPSAGELGEAAGDGRARASRRRSGRARGADRPASRPGPRSADRRARRRPGSGSAAAPPRAPPACGRPAAARRPRRTAWRSTAPARTPLPAHGTSAYRRRTSGDGVRHRRTDRSRRARRISRGSAPRVSRHLKSLLCFRAARDFLPPSCFFPTSPPASASRCPARPARPTRCCSRASPSSERAARHAAAIFTAEPADAQRLADEMPFFAPGLRVAVFPDWETLPYDTFSPHQDLISERLATLWRIRQRRRRRRADAGDDRAGPARAAELPRRLHLPLHDTSSASTRRRSRRSSRSPATRT